MQHLTIHGRVQGVGMREFTRRAADSAGVAGWVRNRDDGTVEAMLAGPPQTLDALVALLGRGPATARVDWIDRRPATDGETDGADRPGAARPFEIRPTVPVPRPALPDADTVAAYRATDYFAMMTAPAPAPSTGAGAGAAGDGRRRVRVDDPPDAHAGWLDALGATSATILTAWNPFGAATDAAGNDRAQARLQDAIQRAGLRHGPASGEDPRGLWDPEPGFCVLDAGHGLVDAWLRGFRQNAVVRIERDRPCRLVWHPAIRGRLAGGGRA